MTFLEKLRASPLLVRSAPFLTFAALTALQGKLGDDSRYWLYLAKTVVGAWVIWTVRSCISEMRWKFSWEGIVVGIAVFGIWVGLEDWYPKTGQSGKPWNPFLDYGAGSALAWFYVVTRIVGSTLVVPPIEEVFYRSLVYRYVADPDFQKVPLGHFAWKPLLVTSGIFALAHFAQWPAALLCALAYQGLVVWKKRLGDAMLAHATTNLLLGLWVVWKGAWQFW